MANILGLSFFFHDSAAALVQNGQLQAATAEERLNTAPNLFQGIDQSTHLAKYAGREPRLTID